MVRVVPHLPEYRALNTRLVLVSFVDAADWAAAWRDETDLPAEIPILPDPARAAYRAYGLQRSVWRSWAPQTIAYYVWQFVRHGRKPKGKRGDPNQLGGDFIVEQGGRIRLAYRSDNATDRPSPAQLLAVLHTIQHG